MPRSLNFKYRTSTFECELQKIDRGKIYGTVNIQTVDHEGSEVELFSLARDGRTVIGLGGTGAGYINKDGYWVESGERIPVDQEGDPTELVNSSARAVATKTAKEKTMVRKVLAIKTNKEEASQDYPAYVLHITDFSPNRATKLQTAVKVSVDKGQIMELFDAAKKEKFKKGWTEV